MHKPLVFASSFLEKFKEHVVIPCWDQQWPTELECEPERSTVCEFLNVLVATLKN